MGLCKKSLFMCLAAILLFSFSLQAEANTGNSTSSKSKEESQENKAPNNQTIPDQYDEIARNEDITLYLNKENLAIKVKDNDTDYVWSSVIDNVGDDKINAAWSNFMNSGVAVEYFEKDTSAVNRIDLMGAKEKTVSVIPQEDGFIADITIIDVGIGFQMVVKVKGNEVDITITNESIIEGDKVKIASIYLYPFLGATKKDEIAGYIFVPDGSGALIRFKDNNNKFKLPYEGKIYGNNEAIEAGSEDRFVKAPYSIKLPVFGIVHEVEKEHQSVFAIVEKGKYNSKIVAYPNGVNTPYNWATANYTLRQTYLQPTSRSMGGIVVYEQEMNDEDIQVKYIFNHGEQADYIGMAKTYQDYLIDQGVLSQKQGTSPDIPLRIDFSRC